MKMIVNVPNAAVRGLALGFMINNPQLGESFVERVQNTSELFIDIENLPAEKADKDQLYTALSCLALTQITEDLNKNPEDNGTKG